MFVTGHLASAYLFHRLCGWNLFCLIVAVLFPDIVDKSLQWGGWFSSGRHVAHNVFALSLTTALVAYWGGRSWAKAWAMGYALHFLGDILFSWDMPWFYPFEWGRSQYTVETVFKSFSLGQLVLDLILSLFSLGLIGWRQWLRRRG